MEENSVIYLQDRSRGCLMGGAAGDALGYPVEFLSEHSILAKYGKAGITRFEIAPYCGYTLVSDDTQMTLFTANGILMGITRGAMRGPGVSTPLGTQTFRHIFKNDRARSIERFAATALNHLRQEILKNL